MDSFKNQHALRPVERWLYSDAVTVKYTVFIGYEKLTGNGTGRNRIGAMTIRLKGLEFREVFQKVLFTLKFSFFKCKPSWSCCRIVATVGEVTLHTAVL